MALMNQLLVLLLIASSISAVVDGQMDGCGSDLSTFLPFPFNSTGGLSSCRPIWNNFILRYSQDKDNIMSIVLSSVYTSGWVGMAFSDDGMMVGSSAMVGWIDRDGRAHIKQYYLRGQSSSDIIVNEGQLLTTSVEPAVVIYGINLYMAFQLKFSAPITQQKLLLAFATATPTNYRLTEHDDKISISFDFSRESVSGTESVPSYPFNLKRNHGVLNILGWGFLLPIGAIIARYCKRWDPSWYYLHVAIQLSGFMFGLAGVVAGISLYGKLNSNVSAHRGLGIFVFVLSILQIIAFFARPDKDSKIRKYWNWYHHWTGRLAVFLASVNIVFGIQVGGGGVSWKIVYGINLSLILVAITVLEIMLWTRWPKHSVSSQAS